MTLHVAAPELLSLEGRTALVAGGAGGIGSAVVEILATMGADVTSVDLPGHEAPPFARSESCDLTDADAVGALVQELGERTGRLDLLVHCAGIARDGVLWKLSREAWDEVLDVNLGSAFTLLQAATPLLRAEGGGSVVLVSSINGERGKFGQANYAASKAGLIGLGRTAARELGRFGVRVNVVSPGLVRTRMTDELPDDVLEAALAETVLGRFAETEDVARTVLYLCSDLSRHVTGQVLRVDGGQLIA